MLGGSFCLFSPGPLVAEAATASQPRPAAQCMQEVFQQLPFLQQCFGAFSFLARGSNLGGKKEKKKKLWKVIYLKYMFYGIVSEFKRAAC